jgi:uncharacterized protein (DUF2384 family)
MTMSKAQPAKAFPGGDEPAAADPAPKRTPFIRRKPLTTLAREVIDRQGQITHFAFVVLNGRDTALAFLNEYHPGLGAKPIDLAGSSLAGYAAVRAEIDRLAAAPAGGQA